MFLAAAAAANPLSEGYGAYQLGDYEKAYELWRPLAEQGNVRAQYLLGTLFAEGQGVVQNPVKSAFWFRKAARRGHAPAQHRLALMYYQGQGIPQDLAQAIGWWRRAARRGHAEALFNLGGLNHLGQGVPQDLDRARELYAAAAERGSAPARQALIKLEKDRERIEQAQEAARERQESAAEAARAASQARAAAAPAREVLGAEWIMSQPPSHFTVQVFAARKRESVDKFLRQFPGRDPVAAYAFRRKGELWHAVVYGSYSSRALAELAVRRLQATGQPVETWIRRMEKVQALEPE